MEFGFIKGGGVQRSSGRHTLRDSLFFSRSGVVAVCRRCLRVRTSSLLGS